MSDKRSDFGHNCNEWGEKTAINTSVVKAYKIIDELE